MTTLLEYEKMTNDLLIKHNLKDWSFGYDNSKKITSRCGLCDHVNKRISITVTHAKKARYDVVKNTILHEIAHALTVGHGHDKIFKKKCLEIGAAPETYMLNVSMDKMYKGVCPTCGHELISYKKKSNCSKCYFENYLNMHMEHGNRIEVKYEYNWEEIVND